MRHAPHADTTAAVTNPHPEPLAVLIDRAARAAATPAVRAWLRRMGRADCIDSSQTDSEQCARGALSSAGSNRMPCEGGQRL